MSDKKTRDRIIEAADRLIYQQGFELTSFSHIADEVGLARGNIYHHFKSKDQILDAVVGVRLDATRQMLARWEAEAASPEQRILRFIDILMVNRAKIMHYGCPVGTLCTELAKLNHPAREEANRLFSLFREWLRRQFELLGRNQDADELAMHLLARSQGVATLAHAFRDEEFVRKELATLHNWLKGVNNCSS
jgi:AcrR family transcriptional regulator